MYQDKAAHCVSLIEARGSGTFHGFGFGYLPSGYVKIAIENDHRNSGFSLIKNGGSFHSYFDVYQRVDVGIWKGLLDITGWYYGMIHICFVFPGPLSIAGWAAEGSRTVLRRLGAGALCEPLGDTARTSVGL